MFRTILAGALALGLAGASAVFGQGITTSAISGLVSDKTGKLIAGAIVTVVHDESGTTATAVTRANGQYDLSGLRVGGPYTVSVNASSLQAEPKKDVYLALDQVTEQNFNAASDVVKLEAFTVTGSTDTTFGGKISTGSAFTAREISETPTVRRSIQDIASLDSRLFLGSLDQGGQLSAQGQNFRFNSFTIDGVQAGDSFGLNSNGFGSLRSPIPLEAIASFSVDLSPYDTRRSGATGAFLNAVIKSGNNRYHGVIYGNYTGQKMRATNPVTGARDTFKERTMGYSLSGPIIKNKLFFYGIYEEFERNAAPPSANFVPDATQLAAVVARAKALGYDAGSLNATNTSKQRTGILKLDWNISELQRATFTYRRTYGEDTNFAAFTGTTATSLSNYWFQQPRNTDAYTAQLFSNWTPDFRTEATVSSIKYDGSPQNNGTPFPDVTINGITGTRLDTGATVTGGVTLGTELSRQLNFITTKETVAKLSGEYSFGDHTMVVGGETDQTKYLNKFVQRVYGQYTYANPTNWNAGTPPSAYQLATSYPGFTLNDAFANWSYNALGFYAEDKWKPSAQLSVVAGLRLDYPYIPNGPPVATGFEAAFGIRNNTTNSGNYTAAPRLGFTYQFKAEKKTQLRGGVGLFQGKNPAVWISNAYSNTGAVASVQATAAQLAGITFQPDVTKQPIPTGTLPTPTINVTAPDFVQPSVWKANLAFDRELPFGGLTFTAEFNYLRTYQGINYEFLNYLVSPTGATTMPDGRTRYAGTITPTGTFVSGGVSTAFPATSVAGRRRITTFADVLRLTNTDKGDAASVTVDFKRRMRNNWAYSVSWTHSRATEVSPVTSSVALSNYQNRASFNPNDDVASVSNTNIPDRIVATTTRRIEFIKGAPTTITGIFQARTGHPYSWVFRGDANGDGFSFNDLLYVPTGPSDTKVRFASQAESDAFFSFVNSTTLRNYTGRNPGRNSDASPWTKTLDLKFVQEVPLPGDRVKLNLFLDFINIGNLIKKEWGLLTEVPFAYRRAVAGATYDAVANGGAGQWIYTFNPTTLDAVPTVANDTPVSRWQVQLGARLQF